MAVLRSSSGVPRLPRAWVKCTGAGRRVGAGRRGHRWPRDL